MMYGGYGGFGMFGGLGMIFYILIFIAIIWAASSFFGRNCRINGCGSRMSEHDHDSRVSESEYDPRISKLEKDQDETRDLLNQILRKLE
jgi:uncharacterized membrane protein